MDYFKRANELKSETIEIRRHIHENAETGLNVENTARYVSEKLKSYGIEPKKCGHGVTATIGKGTPVIMLRADMDALPIEEMSGEEFSCKNGNMHACGHDLHTAMLLTATKMLKENENSLKGTVKLMFQPGEETFEGAKDMLNNGILSNPTPDVAMAYHVAIGRNPVGTFLYNSNGTMMNSVDGFRIIIKGKGTHGAYPNYGVDPINIGVHIHLAFQELIARESIPQDVCTLTIGKFEAGTAPNIIPDTAVLEGTLRSNSIESRNYLVERLREVAEKTAELYRGSVEIETLSSVPPLICNSELTKEMAKYMGDAKLPKFNGIDGITASASEDFASIAEKIPCTYMDLTAGFDDERGDYPIHHPKARFNEDVCPYGAASLAYCAENWLKNH